MAQDSYGNYVVGVEPHPYTPGTSMYGLSGIGPPDSTLGTNGDTYVDNTNGDFYVRYGDNWTIVQGVAGGSGESGVGSPEGIVTASPGTTYVDTSGHTLWLKETGSGNIGWILYI